MTLNDIVLRALQRAGIYAANEVPTSADYAIVGDSFTNALAELSAYRLAAWTIADTPPEFADAFIDYTYPVFAPLFGKPVDDPETMRRVARMRIRELTTLDHRMSPEPVEFF